MEGIEHRELFVNGINMHVAEKGEGPNTILFVHGFPELWYSWRHQIQALSAAGYRCIAPDLRGFGDSDVPSDIASYSIFHLVGDLVALIDALGLEQVIYHYLSFISYMNGCERKACEFLTRKEIY